MDSSNRKGISQHAETSLSQPTALSALPGPGAQASRALPALSLRQGALAQTSSFHTDPRLIQPSYVNLATA